jgi:serine/threonine protein kinase/tetratricopeptide (TPR) repeat protein
MRCPRCDSENPESSRYCSNCAAPLRQPEVSSPPQTQTFEGFEQELERGSLFAGRYHVIEELGSGGMGKVYKVYDEKIKEIVALKLIRPELSAKAKTLERFREEIRLARKIIHKNICRMYDLNEDQGTLYITMEYVPGEDLKSMIRMVGKLSPLQAVFIGKQVCGGLAEAHKLGIVHRDLKPKNIMVDRDGNARIMDFGLARSLEEKGITGGRAMIGTAEYMSPEQAEGKKADSRSDIYSVGVILFEMVSGRFLFEGETALSVAIKHKTEQPPDPRKFNPEVPEALAHLILKCLEKDKEKRYQSAEELLAELTEIEKEFPSQERVFPVKKPSVLTEITQPLRQKKVLVPVLAVLVLAILAIILWRLLTTEALVIVPAGKPSLAVLDFKNDTGEKDLDFLRQALPDNLIQELRSLSGNLTVISADYIYTILRNLHLEEASIYSSENLKAVAEKTGVSHILLGTCLKPAGKPRINYELREARNRNVVGQGIIDSRRGEDFVQLTAELAKKVLANLNLPPGHRSLRLPTQSDLAYKYYQLGRNAERKYKDKVPTQDSLDPDFLEALDWYKKAIQEDSGFDQAYWGLGDAYQSLYVNTKKPEDLELSLHYYDQAYQTDMDSAGANAGLGWAYFLKGDNDAAYKYFKKALALAPEDPSINYNIAGFFKSIGLPEQAIKYYSNAINFGDPSLINYRIRAHCFEHIGKTKEAIDDARKIKDLEPTDLQAEAYYARMLIMNKEYMKAEKEIAIIEELNPDLPEIKYSKAFLLAVRGERETALAMMAEAKKDPYRYTYLFSRVYGVLGMKDEALETIRLGIEKGFQETQDYLYEYPLLESSYFYDSLRDDPRFIEILRQQKKKYDENRRKYGDL